jgi:hypothetical protein
MGRRASTTAGERVTEALYWGDAEVVKLALSFAPLIFADLTPDKRERFLAFMYQEKQGRPRALAQEISKARDALRASPT